MQNSYQVDTRQILNRKTQGQVIAGVWATPHRYTLWLRVTHSIRQRHQISFGSVS